MYESQLSPGSWRAMTLMFSRMVVVDAHELWQRSDMDVSPAGAAEEKLERAQIVENIFKVL